MKCVNHKICQNVMQSWLSNPMGSENEGVSSGAFDHPGVVRFYKCFLSQRAVFFVHHYHAVGIIRNKPWHLNHYCLLLDFDEHV